MRSEIKQLHQRLGTTIVYVTHDQTEAMSLATKIAVMNGGVIEQLGAPQELYDTPNSVFVADFIGSPAMNFIKGQVVDVAGNASFVSTHKGTDVRVPVGHYGFTEQPVEGQEVILGVRPEYITSNATEHQGVASMNLKLTPKLMETTGFDQHVLFDFCGGEIAGRFSSKIEVVINQPQTVHIDLSTISIFDGKSERRI